ncbi:MAG: ankyrin repeat domain-containing protein [Candidatus Latescibacterota bacterium]|nr:ankyrin repeat domain-containing protein [Candidatus Latescibacterota bacterium]
MNDVPPIHKYLTNDNFRTAVNLIDNGLVEDLEHFLIANPELTNIVGEFSKKFFASGTESNQYFSKPKLLWFTAENPVRRGKFNESICDVIDCIIESQRKNSPSTLQFDLDYTLSLLTSGCIANQSILLNKIVRCFVKNGADPNCTEAALIHGERQAVLTLVDHGANINILVAAGIGREDKLKGLLPTVDTVTKRKALACAAACGQPNCCLILLREGIDPNNYNPHGFHSHNTPLQLAIWANSIATVECLLSSGANPKIKDTMHNSDAVDWATYLKRADILTVLLEYLDNNSPTAPPS